MPSLLQPQHAGAPARLHVHRAGKTGMALALRPDGLHLYADDSALAGLKQRLRSAMGTADVLPLIGDENAQSLLEPGDHAVALHIRPHGP